MSVISRSMVTSLFVLGLWLPTREVPYHIALKPI